ncbi:MAG: GHMP kinase [Filomicrobium sp.]
MSGSRNAPRELAADAHAPVVRVRAPARLHLGFLDLNGGLSRKFGSLGLAIDQPVTELTLERAGKDAVEGVEQSRAIRALNRYKSLLKLQSGYRLCVETAIPAHAGLGSGTQLAMAVGAALAQLEGLEADLRALAEMQSRGARSAIGMAAFERGGFVVDGGRGPTDQAPPVVAHAPIPAHWRILLVMDRNRVGVHGAGETAAFEELPEMRSEVSQEMCRVTLMQLLPALAEQDIAAFGAAVRVIQQHNGAYFASAQGGGAWTSELVEKTVKQMAELGAVGIGQSSWGPTGFAFVESAARASEICAALEASALADGLEIVIAKGRNQGASVETAAAGALPAAAG